MDTEPGSPDSPDTSDSSDTDDIEDATPVAVPPLEESPSSTGLVDADADEVDALED